MLGPPITAVNARPMTSTTSSLPAIKNCHTDQQARAGGEVEVAVLEQVQGIIGSSVRRSTRTKAADARMVPTIRARMIGAFHSYLLPPQVANSTRQVVAMAINTMPPRSRGGFPRCRGSSRKKAAPARASRTEDRSAAHTPPAPCPHASRQIPDRISGGTWTAPAATAESTITPAQQQQQGAEGSAGNPGRIPKSSPAGPCGFGVPSCRKAISG